MTNFFPHIDRTLPKSVKEALVKDFEHSDKVMLIISIFGFLTVSTISAYVNNTYQLGIIGGGIALVIGLIAYFMYKGTLISRSLFGISLMIYPAIMIQQQLGMIEMHFGFFLIPAFLALYKDITPQLAGAVAVGIHHLLFTYLQLNNVSFMGEEIIIFGIKCSWSITFLHVVIWIFEVFVMIYIIITITKQYLTGKKLEHQANENLRKLEKEQITNKKIIDETIDIAKDIQEGNLAKRIQANTSDENINNLKNVINEMLDNLNKSIGKDLNETLNTLDNFAKLNFNNKITKDESKISKSLENVQNLITEMLIENKTNGLVLQNSSSTLLSNVERLTKSSNEAAVSLEETAAALEEITSTIIKNTTNIMDMSENAVSVTNHANEGETLAKKTTLAMNQIDEEVSAINEAITVVDQIAFQTNILSLNAAVEAATAGEAGKGFAVVAQEVRNLASRSAEAANEIKTLVENATTKTNEGKSIADKMISGYSVLNENITKTTSLISDIENSSKEQRTSIEQINSTINSLDAQTQENASIADLTKQVALQTDNIAKTIVEDANKKEFEGKNDIKINKKEKSILNKEKKNKSKDINNLDTKNNIITANDTKDNEWESF